MAFGHIPPHAPGYATCVGHFFANGMAINTPSSRTSGKRKRAALIRDPAGFSV